MKTIPTAKEFLSELDEKLGPIWTEDDEEICKAFIEFAKLHVQAAINTCIEEAPSGSSTDTVSYEDVVKALKNCYPESNIK